MQRQITSFSQDQDSHWTARLDCGHLQHVRHDPPLVSRPWVLSEEGRQTQMGTLLDCVQCDRSELPGDFASYKRTPDFTEMTVPAGLRADHRTAPGVWAKIQVQEGQLRYRVPPLAVDTVLTPGEPGIVVPQVLHSVEPIGAVRFFVEFYRALSL
ncbi:MAG: hypothetical protein JWQ73_3239 [Variovorax sp.]|nr:hypothetical protein [Variovorax sp.]